MNPSGAQQQIKSSSVAGPFDGYRNINKQERRTFWRCKIGYVISAYLTDLLGRKKNFILFAVGSFIIVLLYTQMQVSDGEMLWLGFPLGFFASGIFSGMGAFLTELFPTRIRGSGQGFCYNIGRALAAVQQIRQALDVLVTS